MNGDEQFRATIIGGLDYLAQVCFVCVCFIHRRVVDGMPELLQFGDKGFDNGAVDFTLSETFINGSVTHACCCVPGVDAYLNGSHLLSYSLFCVYIRNNFIIA